MKIIFAAVLGLLTTMTLCGQTMPNGTRIITIEPYPLVISDNKTTHLIFPYNIRSVDKGSDDIFVQKAKGVENILQVKAGVQYFLETNLSVITTDGRFYSFSLTYSSEPYPLNLSFANDSINRSFRAMLDRADYNEEDLKMTAKLIKAQPEFLHKKSFNQLMSLKLRGIFISSQMMWFALEAKNESNIEFKTDYLHCTIKDKRQSKLTAVHEIELFTIYYEMSSGIPGNESSIFIFAVPTFTIGPDKNLNIQVTEKGGGRVLLLKLTSRHILKAKTVAKVE